MVNKRQCPPLHQNNMWTASEPGPQAGCEPAGAGRFEPRDGEMEIGSSRPSE